MGRSKSKAQPKFSPALIARGMRKRPLAAAAVAFLAVLIGFIIVRANAGTTSVVVDASLPNPTNVRAYGDDKAATVMWDAPSDAAAKGIVGYYVTWGTQSSGMYMSSKQTTYTIAQIQPLTNGTAYNIKVQSVQGTTIQVPVPNSHDGGSAPEARANGKVSTGATATTTSSSARVDVLRSQMTGFFDDFNSPAGAFDELKWNTATSQCGQIGSAGAFLNDQFHSHNMLRSNCDRGQIISRPRSIFDISGKTEANPGVVVMDFDGITHGRDVWYLDLIPTTARQNGSPLDITSHADIFDTDPADPPMIRFVQAPGDANIRYFGSQKQAGQVNLTFKCPSWDSNGTNFDWCGPNDIKQTLPGPLPEAPVLQRIDTITQRYNPVPNVRQHWRFEISPTVLKVFINNMQVMEGTMPADFVSTKKFYVHSNLFTYNTGKEDPTDPETAMLHWDNFGFNGPAPSTVTHNYLEGGSNGLTPYLGAGTTAKPLQTGPRVTKILVPDPISAPKQARLMFTLGNFGPGTYSWSASDHVLVNGHRYDFLNPAEADLQPPVVQLGSAPAIADGIRPYATSILVNTADLNQGGNDIDLSIGNAVSYMGIFNVHLELDYIKGTAPSYTSPTEIFGGPTLLAAIQPAMTPHDMYLFVEQDMGLAPVSMDHIPIGSSTPPPATPVPIVTPTPAPTAQPTPTPTPNPATSYDLLAQNIAWSPTTLTAGKDLLFSVVVKNTGSDPTPGSTFPLGLTFTVDGTPTNTWYWNPDEPAIPAGGTRTVAANGPIPPTWAATAGTHSVEVFVDDRLRLCPATSGGWCAGLPAETSTANNKLAKQFTVAVAATPTPVPTAQPTPIPTPNPTAAPTPTPTPAPITTCTKLGDTNCDGKVNSGDLNTVLRNYGKIINLRSQGDLTGDGVVNIFDLSQVLQNWGK